MSAAPNRKRGRPPCTYTLPDGTEKPLRDLLTRKQKSDWIAMASIPKDIFEARLAEASTGKFDRRRRTTQSFVRLACELGTTNRKAPMRDPSALDDARRALAVARRALAELSPAERIILAREMLADAEGPP